MRSVAGKMALVVGIVFSLLLSWGLLASADGWSAESGTFRGYYITTKTQWDKLKSQLPLPNSARSLNPNFGESSLILAYWGQKPSAGYQVNIEGVEVQGSQALVQVRLVAPAKDAFSAAVITYPADAKVVEAAKFTMVHQVIFQDAEGQVLNEVSIPVSREYTVRIGDTLWKIARARGLSTEGEIMDFVHQVIVRNRLANAEAIVSGQKLQLPGITVLPARDLALEQETQIYKLLLEKVSPNVVGFGYQGEALSIQEAAPSYTGLRRATLNYVVEDRPVLMDLQTETGYTAAGPWVKDQAGVVLCDIRDVEGANVVNYLSLSPDGRSLVIGARGYENLFAVCAIDQRKLGPVVRYSDEIITKVVWDQGSNYFTVELAGAWGRSRLVTYSKDGTSTNWNLEENWPRGYNLANPRWLGVGTYLSFEAGALGIPVSTDKLSGRWIFDPIKGDLRSVEEGASLL